MKKKFVLTLALVLMVAATIVAAPVTVTGSFKAGYEMTFDPNLVVASNTPEINTDGLAITGDFWKVAIASDLFTFGDDNAVKGTATIYLDKALAAEGVDMGDLTVTVGIGNMGTLSGPSVYSDPNGSVGDNNYKVRMAGKYSTSVTLGYGSMVTAYLGASPVKSTVTAGYVDGSIAGKQPVVVGLTVAPADGIKVAAAYTSYAQNNFNTVLDASGDDAASYDVDGSFGASAIADVAALTGLDFALSASVADVYFLGQEKNNMLVAVNGGYADISAYVEYQLFDGTSNLITKATYAGIENVSLSAKLTLADLSAMETTVALGASYAMGGVTYALDGSYAVDDSALTLTPSVKIAF